MKVAVATVLPIVMVLVAMSSPLPTASPVTTMSPVETKVNNYMEMSMRTIMDNTDTSMWKST